jgi:serine/threonine protein kinase
MSSSAGGFSITNSATHKVCIQCSRKFGGGETACPHDGTLLVALMQDPLIGSTLAGNYQIQSLLGTGGMGVVYKARHGLMDRIVAIKMLQAQLVSDSLSVARFHQESKAASRINHPNVITIHDFGISAQGLPYIVMDYLNGEPLSDAIRESGQISVDRTLKIAMQTCDALAQAHKQGVVHRDLKPGNIVLTTFNEDKDYVKVVDFGVAKLMNQDGQRLTQAGEVCGSPVYMSPEQCMGQELDARSDIYSMGIVLYETLTGKLPILGKTMVDTMSKHCSEMPPSFKVSRPDLYIPERLEAIVFKALAKDPADRQQSMDELKSDLESAIPRAGRTSTLRTADSLVAPALKNTVISKSTQSSLAISKYSFMFMGLGAVLTFLLAFVGFKMMTLNTVMNKPHAAAVTDTAKSTVPSSANDMQKLVSPVRHKLGDVQQQPVVQKEPEVQQESPQAVEAKAATEQPIKSVVPAKKTVNKIVVAPEVHRPKHPKHTAEKAPTQETAHASGSHPAAAKSSASPWDKLYSQLKN